MEHRPVLQCSLMRDTTTRLQDVHADLDERLRRVETYMVQATIDTQRAVGLLFVLWAIVVAFK